MIIKYTKKDFEVFKKECQRLINLLGLNGWEVVYYWTQLVKGRFAEINTESKNMTAGISFTKTIEVDDSYVDNIKSHAQHEVYHLLLGKMSDLGKTRYLNPDEFYSAEEEVVNFLIKLKL